MKRTLLALSFAAILMSCASAQQPGSSVDDAGNLHLPTGETVPYSDLASLEARQNYIDTIRGYEAVLAKPSDWQPRPDETAAEAERRWYDETLYIPWLARVRTHFEVDVEPARIAGVQTDIITPRGGVASDNRNRVLINLHGGGMIVGGRYGGQLESIPISSIMGIRVVTVDYRMAPEHRYPAAEEDVIAVYRELLQSYHAENIGIYGCSSGAVLTGTTVAMLIAAGEPRPGAIGMFGGGPFGGNRYGDSNYIFSGGRPAISYDQWDAPGSYTTGLNVNDHATYPVLAAHVQQQFPPTLLMSGTRDMVLSETLFAHALLVGRGVDAELHVWEGAPHCAFAQPFVDPSVPETQQAWRVMANFFDSHLGREAI